MTEVTDGGVAISIADPVVNYNWKAEAKDWTSKSTGEKFDVSSDINRHFDTAKINFHNLVHEFKNALSGNQQFYFPVSKKHQF